MTISDYRARREAHHGATAAHSMGQARDQAFELTDAHGEGAVSSSTDEPIAVGQR
jgi:hypothetical protein